MMRKVVSPLLKKELRQNAFVYLVPLPILLLALYLRGQGYFLDQSSWMNPVFSMAVPLAVAVAVGLQAFDVEVDAQTRDFLLVKPLSIQRIIREKFLLGWFWVMGWSVAFLAAVEPAYLSWPRPLPVSTWLGGLILCWATLAYGASFLIGLCVGGPRKMLAACCAGGATVAWHFLIWSSWATFLEQRPFFASRPWVAGAIFYAAGLAALAALLSLFIGLTAWILWGRPSLRIGSLPIGCGIGAALLLFMGLGLNFACPPPIRAANLLGLELFDLEQPFWVADGAWRPGAPEIAVAGPGGILGLARPGGKPRLIFQGVQEGDAGSSAGDLAWSPDGKALAFDLDGWVYIYHISTGRTEKIGQGSSPCWARTADALLYAASNAPIGKIRRADGSLASAYRIGVQKFDVRGGGTTAFAELTFPDQNWCWDSRANLFMTVDVYGRAHLAANGMDKTIPLPGLTSGVTWHRFYPVPGRELIYIAAVVSLPDLLGKGYNVHFYRIDLGSYGIELIRKFTRLRFSNLILDPATGSCLFGENGVYRRVEIFEPEGGGR